MTRKIPICAFPACPSPGSHFHHIIYKPRPCWRHLCSLHHREITICNVNQAEVLHRKLTNKDRWYVWGRWLKGEMKPQMTARARAWMKTWRD